MRGKAAAKNMHIFGNFVISLKKQIINARIMKIKTMSVPPPMIPRIRSSFYTCPVSVVPP